MLIRLFLKRVLRLIDFLVSLNPLLNTYCPTKLVVLVGHKFDDNEIARID